MLIPLYVLAFGAIFAGMAGYHYFVGEGRAEFWRQSLLVLPEHDAIEHAHHGVPVFVTALPFIVGIAGIAVAYLAYIARPGLPAEVAGRFRGIYQFLLNKWYFDELYDRIFVRPSFSLGYGFWKGGDGAIIDGLGPDGLAAATLGTARRASRLQTGYVYHYALAIVVGVVAFVTWYLLLRSGG
jgi:NADH-quinone oxidoreductase subunit L